ncbi:RNA 2',3'-cyclic phosphodiesterase [Paenibacillus guangzhouensis]|uniref:RNA 2',3'-cyclic phosphodiesterase n=1 Tax=Paenibacillus guangzhouensis TaxID=1473112 RepID=UPI001266D75A|nr:RNA 2',3'-cyclic phosphodiesterase [Paenibacillus guangzhouensis]
MMNIPEQGAGRLFIAVGLGEAASMELERWQAEAEQILSFAKWVHPEDYHITVQFLGDTRQEVFDQLVPALKEAVRQIEPFTLELSGTGTFGTASAPRVLWAGVRGDIPALENVVEAVLDVTKPLGFMPEDRPYRPHITMARKYRGHEEFNIDSTHVLQPMEEIAWSVDHLVIYKTHLDKKPMYEKRALIPFA